MMVALKEVLVELFLFTLGKESNEARPAQTNSTAAPLLSAPTPPQQIAPVDQPLLSPTPVKEVETVSAETGSLLRSAVPTTLPDTPSSLPEVGTVAYVKAVQLSCFLRPVRSLDSVIGVVPYGSSVNVLQYQGRWAQIERKGEKAWVEKDGLVDERSEVYPHFIEGVIYEPSHPVTEKIRVLINDEFAAAALLAPLLDIEYVTYRLFVEGRVIKWPKRRPRLAGDWHTILKGVSRIHMDIRPTTHCIMETIDDDNMGQVFFVESVQPNESIVVSSVGGAVEGRYTKETMSKGEWQQLRPTFIEIL